MKNKQKKLPFRTKKLIRRKTSDANYLKDSWSVELDR